MVSEVAIPAVPRCLIIAEAGVNHDGSEATALRLIDAAADAGADIVKFQTFKAERLVTRSARKAAYQKATTGDGNQFSMLQALELSDEAHLRLAAHCQDRGIEFLSTAFDTESANFLIGMGVRRIKIPSGELTNAPFIRFLAAKGLQLIMSTGMATMEEVADAVGWVAQTRAAVGLAEPIASVLTLLHCTSNYPTALGDVNLLAIRTLAERFQLPVGYSDHTAGIFVASLARVLGATVFEKHFTLDRTLPGPDHAASLEPSELGEMVRAIRDAELAMGDGRKVPTGAEFEVRVAARRSVTLASRVEAGQALVADDLTLMRPGDGIAPCELGALIGRRAVRALDEGVTLRWEDLTQ
ncbi:MAG: N-acetylneuraminate synthase [Gammaproteobacteria bacterium]|jgi:N,N'-diacetyllegionaminate synthase|nr:N-acetylneuraminate synthase [Gammaproteobacteria bacterium]MBU0769892.1 N-acetylneuraminate synthase [Gammaproteobacteria bacterium]MBU0854697.1 N-acetylneuraminate synthase [Gammaproteobacteria bacterium]MBU1845430.1 N-acetylneuraminate synthase [Gammaproteobacteria bacterium]